MAHRESPSTMNFLKPILSASQRPVRRAIISTSFTVLKPKGPQKEISLTPALSLKIPLIPYWPGLPIALPSKLSFKVPSGGGFQAWQNRGRVRCVNATSFQHLLISSIEYPRKLGRTETQEATRYLTLKAMASLEEESPLKHIEFLSFQRVQMTARKDVFHIILPLAEPTPID